MSARLQAIVPPAISRKWNSIALRQLCELASEQAERIDRLEKEAGRADDHAEFWREEALRLHEQLAQATDQDLGITPQGNLVLAPKADSVVDEAEFCS